MPFPFLPIAIAAWSAGLSKIGQDQANDENAEQAQLNRDFQERMSNTQYQRARKDLEAAGYNPMLAVANGGAGNVSGSSAASMQNALSGAAQATSAIPNTLIQKAQVDNISAQTDKTRAETQGQLIDNTFAAREKETGIGQGQTQIRQGESAIQLNQQQLREATLRLDTLTKTQKATIEEAINQARKSLLEGDTLLGQAAVRALEYRLRQYDVPYAKAVAAYYMGAGKYEPFVGGAKQLLNLINPFAGSAKQLLGR